jgi:hypothetical protein
MLKMGKVCPKTALNRFYLQKFPIEILIFEKQHVTIIPKEEESIVE